MKKITKALVLVMVLALCATVFAGCAKKLSGKYSNAGGVIGLVGGETVYEFKGNKVTITATVKGVIGGETSTKFEGTYEFAETKDGDALIKLTFGEDGKAYSGNFHFSEGTKDGKAYIKIGAVEYYKQ